MVRIQALEKRLAAAEAKAARSERRASQAKQVAVKAQSQASQAQQEIAATRMETPMEAEPAPAAAPAVSQQERQNAFNPAISLIPAMGPIPPGKAAGTPRQSINSCRAGASACATTD